MSGSDYEGEDLELVVGVPVEELSDDEPTTDKGRVSLLMRDRTLAQSQLAVLEERVHYLEKRLTAEVKFIYGLLGIYSLLLLYSLVE